MKYYEVRQNGNNFEVEKKSKLSNEDSYIIFEKFSSSEEACEYLMEHGEVAETTNSIEFVINERTMINLIITNNFDNNTYNNLIQALKEIL